MWTQLFLLPFFFAMPEFAVNWDSEPDETIRVALPIDTKFLQTCVKSGLEAEYRTNLQLCKRRPLWFDTCQDARELSRKVHFDAISRNYEVLESWAVSDDTSVERFSSFVALKKFLFILEGLPLSFIAWSESEFVHSKRSYISLRVESTCKGEKNETLEAMSQLLTFGMVEVSGFDTGWVDFRLHSENQ